MKDSEEIPIQIELIQAVWIPALGVYIISTIAVVPTPTKVGSKVPNGCAARLSLLLWIANWPYSCHSIFVPSWIRLNSSYSTDPSLVAIATIILADLGLNTWYFSVLIPAIPGRLVKAAPVVDPLPTVQILICWPPVPITLDAPILTNALGGAVDSPIVVWPIAVKDVVIPSSSKL